MHYVNCMILFMNQTINIQKNHLIDPKYNWSERHENNQIQIQILAYIVQYNQMGVFLSIISFCWFYSIYLLLCKCNNIILLKCQQQCVYHKDNIYMKINILLLLIQRSICS